MIDTYWDIDLRHCLKYIWIPTHSPNEILDGPNNHLQHFNVDFSSFQLHGQSPCFPLPKSVETYPKNMVFNSGSSDFDIEKQTSDPRVAKV